MKDMEDMNIIIGNILLITGISTVSGAIVSIILGACLNWMEKDYEDEKEHEEKKNDELFDNQYLEEWNEMEESEINTEKLKELINDYNTVDTPKGTVIMCYDVVNESFNYWSNNKDNISYSILDAVARQYSVVKGYKRIFINMKEELDIVRDKVQQKVEDKITVNTSTDKTSEIQTNSELNCSKKNVFAQFKNYNNVGRPSSNSSSSSSSRVNKTSLTNNNASSSVYVPNKANKFKYKGNLTDWNTLTVSSPQANSHRNIGFAEFKKLQKKND